MTRPFERTRAVLQTSEFLTELSYDTSVPERIRRDARFLLRHFPTKADMLMAGRIEEHAEKQSLAVLGRVFSSSLTDE